MELDMLSDFRYFFPFRFQTLLSNGGGQRIATWNFVVSPSVYVLPDVLILEDCKFSSNTVSINNRDMVYILI